MLDIDNLNSFLLLGYSLDYKNKNYSFDYTGIDKNKYSDYSYFDLLELGSDLFRESISSNFETNRKHLVPISGGLDSRAILAGLLEFTEASNICTYTFGIPDSFDYIIGNYIAEKIGTNHTIFNLNNESFFQEELEDISLRIDHQGILFHHWPVWKVDEKFGKHIHWTGLLGDPITGSKLLNQESDSVEKAKNSFIYKNSFSNKLSTKSSINHLIQLPSLDNDSLTIDEQLDFENRQLKYIIPNVIMKNYSFKAPFLYPPLMNFMLSIDNKYREKQSLYKNILLHLYPLPFSYKIKANYGLSLNANPLLISINKINNKITSFLGFSKNRNLNYLDFCESIREKPDLKELISSNIYDLKKRDIIDWIDIERMLTSHISGKNDFSNELIILSSLEIHIKSGLEI